MPQAGHIALELMINKFLEFIEWLFQKRDKTKLEKLLELNSTLNKELNLSIFDIAENSLGDLRVKLEKIELQTLDNIISAFFNVSISTNKKNQTFERLKSNTKLNERIMEIILFTENKFNKLSLNSSNIKNSLRQKLDLEK